MKNIAVKYFKHLLVAMQPKWKRKCEILMASRHPRSKHCFMKPFESDPVGFIIAERLFYTLSNENSEFVVGEFTPHLDDLIADDYGIVDEDLEELLLELLIEYDLPKKGIRGNNMDIITLYDVVKFASAVAQRYPMKSQ